MIYTFDQFSLDTDALKLTNGEGPIALEPQVFDLLTLLVENRDRIISKDEIIEQVWDGRIVSDGTLNTRMNAVRRAVGDNGQAQSIVRTFPRRGFRFMAEVGIKDENVISLNLPEQPSIVVMPFENLSGDPDQEYFSDGITGDIITALSNIKQFFVIARNSSFYFKGKLVDTRKVAEEFGVRYVLEGSVRKSADQVRISAQLVDGISGNSMWAERYDRKLDEIFALQDELTETIVGCIAPALRLAEAERATRMPNDSLVAWDMLHRGNFHLYRWTPEDFIEARKWYELAIEKDSEFASAYAALSELFFIDSIYRFSSTHELAIAQSVILGQKAVELDRSNAMTHNALGRALMGQGMDTGKYDGAITAFELTLSINPSHASAHYYFGRTLNWSIEAEHGRFHLLESMRLSPRDPFMGVMLAAMAETYFIEGNFSESVNWYERSIGTLHNVTWPARSTYVAALAHLDRRDEALAAFEKLQEMVPDFTPDWVKNDFKCAFQADILSGLAKIGLEP